MKYFLISILICVSLITKATPADSLKRRKHFAIEADVAYANARIKNITPWNADVTMATLKAPNFMCYNFALVYNWRGYKRDCSDPVHEFSIAGGASIMKMNVEETMQNYQVRGYDYTSNVSFGTEKINFTYNPTEICLLFRYTYSSKKYFLSLNAGVSTVLVNESNNTTIQKRRDTAYITSSGTTYETINSTWTVDHYLVPNNSTNTILGIRFGYNGKRISPYHTLQRHGATDYSFAKFGIGAMVLL
jgi:hypothetical protein